MFAHKIYTNFWFGNSICGKLEEEMLGFLVWKIR